MKTLSSTPLLTVLLNVPTQVATLRRSSVPAGSPRALELAYSDALLLLDDLDVRGILLDSRDALGRNSPEYEDVMIRLAKRIANRVPRYAVLLRTAIGTLQARRMESEAERSVLISDDLQECLQFLHRAPRVSRAPERS